MTALFHISALAEHQFALALPLVQITWPEIDLAGWTGFVRGIHDEGGGLLALKEPDDYICGVVAYRRQVGIAGPVLSVPLFTVADLANRPHLARALAEAVEHLGRQLGCRVGHMEFNWRQSRLIDNLRRLGWPAESALLERRLDQP
jgi:hypothetical protein